MNSKTKFCFWISLLIYALSIFSLTDVVRGDESGARLPAYARISRSTNLRVGEPLVRGPDRPEYLPDEILVAFRPGTPDATIYEIHRKHGAISAYPGFSGRFERVKFSNDKAVKEMVRLYKQEPDVKYAEPNYIVYAFFVPNDPFYEYQWHFHSSDEGGVNMEKAWDLSTGEGVVVAVVDTGVAYEDFEDFHQAPDLEGVSFVPGYDFVDDDTHPNDENGHGTHVTGTIAQKTNNKEGVAGAAFNCSIMPIRVLDKDGYGTYSAIVDGVDFAVENGAKVINMSLGSGQPSEILESSLAHAHDMGVTLVAAAGNEFFWGSPTSYPAAYDAYCITVGAVRYDGKRAPYSNEGDYIDLTAPGGDLSVDQNEDDYADGVLQQAFMQEPQEFHYWFFQGTSMAAPHVSAAAAILISHGVTEPDEVTEALMFSARDEGTTGWDREYGWGILDVHAALNYVHRTIRDVAITTVKGTQEVISGEPARIIATVRNNGTQPENARVSLRDAAGNEIDPQPDRVLELASSYEFTFQWDTGDLPLGNHDLTLELAPLPGEINLASNTRTITLNIVSAASRTMYVEDVHVETYKGFIAWSAVATVTVVSGDGKPVPNAWVFGSWSGPVGWPDFAFTDMDGVATFYSGPIFGAGEVDFTVHSISKEGWRYGAETTVPDNTTPVDIQERKLAKWGALKRNHGEILPASTNAYQNYPNPFNPDTWIPYQLAGDAEVRIKIYDVTGRLVRTLELGTRRAGFYLGKDAAAHWDGRDENGEKVASGVYFYSLEAGDNIYTRKMTVIE